MAAERMTVLLEKKGRKTLLRLERSEQGHVSVNPPVEAALFRSASAWCAPERWRGPLAEIQAVCSGDLWWAKEGFPLPLARLALARQEARATGVPSMQDDANAVYKQPSPAAGMQAEEPSAEPSSGAPVEPPAPSFAPPDMPEPTAAAPPDPAIAQPSGADAGTFAAPSHQPLDRPCDLPDIHSVHPSPEEPLDKPPEDSPITPAWAGGGPVDPESMNVVHQTETKKAPSYDWGAETGAMLYGRSGADWDAEDAPRCGIEPRISEAAPFPNAFPASQWERVEFPYSGTHYLRGRIFSGDMPVAEAVAVPGAPGRKPPGLAAGFGRFLRDTSGRGYWVDITFLPR